MWAMDKWCELIIGRRTMSFTELYDMIERFAQSLAIVSKTASKHENYAKR